MKRVIQGVSLLIIFIHSLVWAGEISEVSLARLMALSGLNKQVAEWPGMVRGLAEQAIEQGSPISDEVFEDVQRSMEGAIQPFEILSAIGIEIKNNITESGARDLLAWYESDLGRRITEAEENATTSASYQEMTREAQTLLSDEKRVKFAKKINTLVNGTELSMQMWENAGLAVFTAVSIVNNPDQPVNTEAFKAKMSPLEQQVRAYFEQILIVYFVYSYKDLDMASIKTYVEFLERPSTSQFSDSIMKGMKIALNQSINIMAKSLADKYKKDADLFRI